MKIKALILDAGGVMVRPVHGAWNIPAEYKNILGEYAKDVGSEKWNIAHAKNGAIIRENALIPGDTDAEYRLSIQYFAAMAQDMNWQISKNQLDELAYDFAFNPRRYVWYDDVTAYLRKWHGNIKTGILSDAMPSFHNYAQLHESHQYIDFRLLSTDIGATKPDARMYETICSRLNVNPEECLFVDDREINLSGAIKCGLNAVQMDREGDVIRWNGPVVHNFEELNRFMEELN